MNFLNAIFRLHACLCLILRQMQFSPRIPVSHVTHLYLVRFQTNGNKMSHEALYTNRKCENETFLQTQGFYDSKRNIKGSFN